MASKLLRWIDERWPLTPLLKLSLDEEIPGGASYFYIFGSSALVMFAVQAATGIFQLFYYVPTVDHAYSSLSYLRLSVPFGWLIHSLHYWGANAMLVLVWMHLARVFIWGAYKHPRELTWLVGVFLLLLTLGMSFTGAPLPWDETGYWATEVGTSIAGTVPIVGQFLLRLLRGAETMGQLALSRFFILHVAILPGLLATLILVHLISFRKSGSVGPWSPWRRKKTGPFWPDQVMFDAVAGVVFFLIVVALAVFARPPFSGPADAVDTSFEPKPEWNFLFLYQAIKAFKGVFEPVGTVDLPLVATIAILLVPFIDRRQERDPSKRPLAMAVLCASVAGLVALTIAGALSKPGVKQQAPPSASAVVSAAVNAGKASAESDGSKLFQTLGCTGCHQINGSGGKVGPDLSAEGQKGRTREWLVAQIQNPKAHNPQSVMPSFSTLSSSQMDSLIGFLQDLGANKESASPSTPDSFQEVGAKAAGESAEAQKAETQRQAPVQSGAENRDLSPQIARNTAAGMIGNPDHGATLFASVCASCHGPRGTDKVPNPGSDDGTVPPLNPIDRELFNSDPAVFAAKIDTFLQHGSTPAGPKPALKMPDFGDSNTLTQQEISNLEAYVLKLNGVERSRILHPGISPTLFFILVIVVFGVSGLGLMGALYKKKNNPGS